MFLSDHGDSASNSRLNHQIHVRVIHQLKLDASKLEHGIPRKTRSCEVMCWIKLVRGQSHFSKTLKDIGKKQDIALQVDVMVVSKGLTVEGLPDIFRVLVVLIANAFFIQLAVELLLWW